MSEVIAIWSGNGRYEHQSCHERSVSWLLLNSLVSLFPLQGVKAIWSTHSTWIMDPMDFQRKLGGWFSWGLRHCLERVNDWGLGAYDPFALRNIPSILELDSNWASLVPGAQSCGTIWDEPVTLEEIEFMNYQFGHMLVRSWSLLGYKHALDCGTWGCDVALFEDCWEGGQTSAAENPGSMWAASYFNTYNG